MLPVECIVIALSIFARIIFIFESDNIVYNLTQSSVILMMVAAILAGNIAVLIFAVIRYYKNLFTLEGYLSFTLPVTASQHIAVKVVTAVIFDIIALITAVLAFCIAASGNFLVEFINLLEYAFSSIFKDYNKVHLVLYAVEILICLVISSFQRFLLFYSFITIGQMAKRHKLLLAFGIYGIYTFLSGAVSTIFNIIANVVFLSPNLFGDLMDFLEKYPYLSAHISLLFTIVVSLVLGTVYYAISNIIIRKKLNLE